MMNQATDFDEELLEIYGELSRDRLMTLVVNYARDRLDAGGCSIFLHDDIADCYVLRATTGLMEDNGMPGRIEYTPGEGLTGWIAKHGRPLRIANVRDQHELERIAKDLVWTQKYAESGAKPGQAYMGVPILARDGKTVLGVLRVAGKTEEDRFDRADEQLLSHVAKMVSIAIENSHRYEQERRRARYFWLVLDITSELDPRDPPGEVVRFVVDRVCEGFRAEACLIYLRTEEDVHQVRLRAASGLPQTLEGRLTYSEGQGLTGHIVRSGTTVLMREPDDFEGRRDPHRAEIAARLPSERFRSFIGVPLQSGEETLGTLELINKIPSGPGHRDWFTDDDEGYLRLLATSIAGVLEGARYLQALNEVGVTAMRMQRVASFGSLAQRIRHEAANPLTVARLALTNLRSDLQGELDAMDQKRQERMESRLDVIEESLDDVSGKLLEMLKFSQRIGFVRTTRQWNNVVREVLIWLAAERQRRNLEVHVRYGELPPLFIEPNELFGVLVTVLRLAMEAVERGGLIELSTSISDDGRWARTVVSAPDAPLGRRVASIVKPASGSREELSPLHFEWALAQETVEAEYGGVLAWKVGKKGVRFSLDLPLEEVA